MATRAFGPNLPDNFTSDDDDDDQDYEVETNNPGTGLSSMGQRTIQSLFENAAEDRKRSRKALENHTPTARTPGTQYQRKLWRNYLRAFMLTLGLPSEACPDGDHMYRFIETIVHNLRTRIPGKPVISRRTIVSGLGCLNHTLTEEFAQFKITQHEAKKIESLLNRLEQEGKLVSGVWKEKQFLGTASVRKLAIAWLTDALENGTRAWDITIMKLTSVLTVSACAARGGDIMLSSHYKNTEALTWADLDLRLNESSNSADALTLTVQIRYEKGSKFNPQDARVLHFESLHDVEQNILCPVKLLTIHGLRTGALEETSIHELVRNMATKRNRRARWKTPKNPVFSSMLTGQQGKLVLHKPGNVKQLGLTLQEMCWKAGITARVTSHSLRYGAARDMAHLKPGAMRGAATMEVAQSLGHSMTSFMTGVTSMYTGGTGVDVYKLRVESDFKDPRAPEQSFKPYQKPRITAPELDDFAEANGYDPTQRRQALKALHRQRFDEYLAEAADEDALPAPPIINKPKASARSTVTATTSSGRAPPIESPNQFEETNTDDEEDDEVVSENNGACDMLNVLSGRAATHDEDETQTSVLDAALGATSPFSAGQTSDRTNPLCLPTAEFIQFFASINVVLSECHDDDWQPEVDKGNSRAQPTRFLYRCSNEDFGCKATFPTVHRLQQHVESCTASADSPIGPGFECDQCKKTLATEQALSAHTKAYHDFSKPCDIAGCLDRTTYETRADFMKHRETHFWDSSTTCLVPGCDFTRTFGTMDAYRGHLEYHHKLTKVTSRKQYMPVDVIPRPPAWGKRVCVMPYCPEIFHHKHLMLEHLTDPEGHALSPSVASNKVEEMLLAKQVAKQKKDERRKAANEADPSRDSGWGTRFCYMSGCELKFKGKAPMMRHLTDPQGHALDTQAALSGIDDMLKQARDAKAANIEKRKADAEITPPLKQRRIQRDGGPRGGSARKH